MSQKPPMYWRVLRLRHVRPNSWQRLMLVEGSFAAGVVLALSGAASGWAVIVLPLSVAVVVKGHDLLAAWLPPRRGSEGG